MRLLLDANQGCLAAHHQETATKVLFMCEWTGRGIHPVWLQYAHGLQRAGADVLIATSGREYDSGTIKEALDYHLGIARLPKFFDRENGFRDAKKEMAEWLSVNAIDLIHCQGFRELYHIAQACRIAKRRLPIVMTDRNSLAWTGLGAMKRIALLLRERPNVIVLSEYYYKKLSRIPGMANKIAYIPNGVNTSIFQYFTRPIKPKGHHLRLIYPASFTPLKGHEAFLRLCKKMATAGRQFEVLLAGYGPLEGYIRNKTKSLGLTKMIRPLGRIPWKQLPRVYEDCDIGIFPSLSEMMPNAVLEMMASGLPVVAYETGGIPQMIEHKKTGYIAPLGDQRLFRRHLEHLMDNKNEAKSVGNAASDSVHNNFSIEIMGKRTLAYYHKLCLSTNDSLHNLQHI